MALHVRHHLGMLLLPVLVLLAVQDAAQRWMPEWLEGDYALLVFVPPLVVLLGLFPVLLRHVWRTRPLEAGPLRTRLEAAAARHGFRIRDILVWQTNSMVVNAAVAGFLPRLRYVFLTDGLLEWLDDEEIEAVFGHELGHVRHRHVPLRVAAMLLPLSLWLLVSQACPSAMERAGDVAGRGRSGRAGAGLRWWLWRRWGPTCWRFSASIRGGWSPRPTCLPAGFATGSFRRRPSCRPWRNWPMPRATAGHEAGSTPAWRVAWKFCEPSRATKKASYDYHRRVRLLGCMVVGLAISPVISPLLISLLLG